jgi:hypothetical protein
MELDQLGFISEPGWADHSLPYVREDSYLSKIQVLIAKKNWEDCLPSFILLVKESPT